MLHTRKLLRKLMVPIIHFYTYYLTKAVCKIHQNGLCSDRRTTIPLFNNKNLLKISTNDCLLQENLQHHLAVIQDRHTVLSPTQRQCR